MGGDTGLTAALDAWRALFAERVISDAAALRRYGRGDAQAAPAPAAVLRLESTEEVVRAIGIASTYGVALHPISRGQNWGYGAACPMDASHVVVDLRGMNRVLEVDDDLAYAVLEPGVTQRQLREELRARGDRLMLDCTDAPSDTSFVGNCLERGIGFSPHGYRLAHTCGLEVVLADGSVVTTGFGGMGPGSLTHLRKAGVGPDVEGLFSQSNLGIVTKMGVWLQPRPECIATYWAFFDGDDAFATGVTRMRDSMLHDGLRTVAHAGNWLGEAGWLLMGGIYGSRESVALSRSQLERRMAGAATLVHFVDPADPRWRARVVTKMVAALPISALPVPDLPGLRWAMRAAGTVGYLRPFEDLLEPMARMVAVMSGEPLDEALFPSGHLDVDDERESPKRHFSLSAVCPSTAADVRSIVECLRTTLRAHDRPERLWMAMQDARSATFIQHLFHDRHAADAETRSSSCYEALWAALGARGYPPYRSANRSMADLDRNGTAYWQLVHRLKVALDPGGVISPGTYAPGP